MTIRLHQHQRTAVRKLRRIMDHPNGFGGAILGDTMGLGKTVQEITTCLSPEGTSYRNLVVAPASTIPIWQAQLREHFKPVGSCYTFYGKGRLSSGAHIFSPGPSTNCGHVDVPEQKMVR